MCGLWASRQAADASFDAPAELDREGIGFRDQRTADIDGDGLPDLAVEWGSDPNTVLMPHTLDLMLGSAHGFELVEVDGIDDQVFRADGDAYVPVPEARRWISAGASPSPVIADFHHDGASDILTAAGYGTRPSIGVQTSNRDGTFTPHLGATLPYTATSFAGDVDGDGNLDGVFVHGGGRLSVALGDGHGALPTARTFAFEDEGRIEQAFVVDIDGDGRADLVEATTDASSDPVPAPSPIHIRVITHACL